MLNRRERELRDWITELLNSFKKKAGIFRFPLYIFNIVKAYLKKDISPLFSLQLPVLLLLCSLLQELLLLSPLFFLQQGL